MRRHRRAGQVRRRARLCATALPSKAGLLPAWPFTALGLVLLLPAPRSALAPSRPARARLVWQHALQPWTGRLAAAPLPPPPAVACRSRGRRTSTMAPSAAENVLLQHVMPILGVILAIGVVASPTRTVWRTRMKPDIGGKPPPAAWGSVGLERRPAACGCSAVPSWLLGTLPCNLPDTPGRLPQHLQSSTRCPPSLLLATCACGRAMRSCRTTPTSPPHPASREAGWLADALCCLTQCRAARAAHGRAPHGCWQWRWCLVSPHGRWRLACQQPAHCAHHPRAGCYLRWPTH